MTQQFIRLTEQDLQKIINETVNRILSENNESEVRYIKEESYVDRMIRAKYERFDRSKLKPIFDNLGLKRGDGKYTLSGDYGYESFKLNSPNVEFREYDNGKVYVLFGYNDNAGAWGGYTKKYEVTDPNIFKSPNWMRLIKQSGEKTSPDVIMMS